MTRLMQTASALTLVAALAAAPVAATAQEAAEPEAEQVIEETAQETEEAAGEAAEAAGEAAEEAGEAAGEAGQAAEQAGEEAAQTAEQPAEPVETEVEVIQDEAEPAETETEVTVEGETAEGEEVQQEVEGTITLQDQDSILASELMGATVYNAEGEAVGDIDDAIISFDGTVEGVVIGVGGFLGIGEKRVAVELQQITVQTDENRDPQLLIDTTREALEEAPDFVSAEEQQAEQQRMEGAPQTGTVPAEGMAPAGGVAPAEGVDQ